MKIILSSFLVVIALAWGWGLQSPEHPAPASLPWMVYQEGLYLSGLLSIALMSLAMILSTRPAWLERPLGGMDRIYRMHKWSGILAFVFAAMHWLIEMAEDPIKALAGRSGRVKLDEVSAFPEPLSDLGEGLGEWAFYVLIALVALTLWKRFSYRLWRPLHRAMPVLYLLLVFHTVVLAPADYWNQPVGLLLAVLFVGGILASVLSLTARIGRRRRVSGEVLAVQRPSAEIVEVTCRLAKGWRGHRPGQFAFVTFDTAEGAHPFTIASADRGDNTIAFAIKALGDYTRTLSRQLTVGSLVEIEGPYGVFEPRRARACARQIWVAGGIGITPFIAWLESLQSGKESALLAADLHYCVRDRDADPFVARIEELCAALPDVRLHCHDRNNGPLTAEALFSGEEKARQTEVWFCGPCGLAETLRNGMRQLWPGRVRFHQEAFEMR